jgi:hypothetical protein
LIPCISFAGEEGQKIPPGWHGNISIGAGILSGIPSQLDAENADRKIASLDEKAGHATKAVPYALFRLGYKIDNKTDIYLKNRDGEGISLALGMDREIPAVGKLGAEIFYAWRDVWEDPYITGEDREKTTSGELGAELSWDRIMHSGLNVSYVFARRFIDDDEAGDRDEDLRRQGYRHALRAGYVFNLGRAGQIEPFIRTVYFDARGKSTRYAGYGGGLKHTLYLSQWIFKTTAFIHHHHFSEDHPDFGEKRSENHMGISENIIHNNPFGWKNFFYNIRLGYFRVSARQDFYETSLGLLTLGAGYSF